MINDSLKNKKKKAFTLVELMLVLVIFSLMIASSYSLITRRHRVMPKRAVHGQYLCLKELQPKGDHRPTDDNDIVPTANNHCYADENREIHLSGSIITRQQCVKACRFVPPRTSAYIYMQLVGGGGAGGNANYNPLLTNQNNEKNKYVYEYRNYNRSINLVERDWKWYEKNTHLTGGSDPYTPKDGGSAGYNQVTYLDSWGGATTFAGTSQKADNSTSYNGTLIKNIKYSIFNPRLTGKKTTCSGSCSDEVIEQYCTGAACANNCTGSDCRSVIDASYSYALNGPLNEAKRVRVRGLSNVTSLWSPGIRTNSNYRHGAAAIGTGNEVSGDGEATRGISRDYVNKHYTFHAMERQVAPNVEKNRFVDRFLYSGPLFDDTLFLHFLNDYVVEDMFAYDIGGQGPSAPGFNITAFKNLGKESYESGTNNMDYSCVYYTGTGHLNAYNSSGQAIHNFADCVKYAFEHGYLGDGRNRYCSLPLVTGNGNWPACTTNAQNNYTCGTFTFGTSNHITKATLNTENVIKEILGYENTSTTPHTFVRGTCPIMNHYWIRSSNASIPCSGGSGGVGSIFTSPMVEGFHYEFFPVLGIRWRNALFLNDNANRCNSATSGDLSLMCYQRYSQQRACNPNESGVSDDAESTTSNEGDVDSIDFRCSNTLQAVAILPALKKTNTPESGGYVESSSADLWQPVSGGTLNTLNQSNIAGVFATGCTDNCYSGNIPKLEINGTKYKAPAFSQRPQIYNAWEILDFNQPQFKNVHFFVGGYPHGFGGSGTNLGNGVGVGFSYEGLVDSNNRPDIVYNACIAPGVSARSNKHQISPDNYTAYNVFWSEAVNTGVSGSGKNNATTNTGYQFRFNPEYIPASRNILSAGSAAANIYNNFNSNACNQGYLDFSSYFGKSCFAPGVHLSSGFVPRPKYYWFKKLMENSDNDPWIMCYNSSETAQCMTAVDLNANTLGQLIVNIFGGGSYGSFAFGMTSNSNSDNPARDCLNVPLKRLASEDGNAIMPDIARPNTSSYSSEVVEKAYSARIPRAFGTANNTPWNLTKQIIRDSLVNEKGQYRGEGSCPTAPNNASVGNTGFDYNRFGNRLMLIGRTGFLLRRNNTEWRRTNASSPWVPTENSNVRDSLLGAGASTRNAAQTTRLSSERTAGLEMSLKYYTHALSYGEPGRSGNYRAVFARSFTNANVILVPGQGGRASVMDPRESSRRSADINGGQGGITAVVIGCDVNEGDDFDSLVINNSGQLEVHTGDDFRIATCASIIRVDGGRGGRSGRLDPAEYGNLHQNHDFIRKANEKLSLINGSSSSTNGIRDNADNNFKHCSLSAPNPWKESATDGDGCVTIDDKHYCIDQSVIDRYRIPNNSGEPVGPPLIEGDCYGNSGVMAEDSDFAAQANLFDLEQFLGDDIQPELIGKGGDGGFVRDDCWVVPQYFEITNLQYLRTPDLGPNGSNVNTSSSTYRTVNRSFNTTWGSGRTGLTGFTQSGRFLSVEKSIGQTSTGHASFDNRYNWASNNPSGTVLENNLGYTAIWPSQIFHTGYNSRSCRTWGARYTGKGTIALNSSSNTTALNEIMSVDDYDKSSWNSPTTANRLDKIVGETGHYRSPDGQIIRYRITGLTTFNNTTGNRAVETNNSQLINSIFGTEIGGTDGYPGAVFITW